MKSLTVWVAWTVRGGMDRMVAHQSLSGLARLMGVSYRGCRYARLRASGLKTEQGVGYFEVRGPAGVIGFRMLSVGRIGGRGRKDLGKVHGMVGG
jgi:hypothetical protein